MRRLPHDRMGQNILLEELAIDIHVLSDISSYQADFDVEVLVGSSSFVALRRHRHAGSI